MSIQLLKKSKRYVVQQQDNHFSIRENLNNGHTYTLYYTSDLGKEETEFLKKINKELDETTMNSFCQWFVKDRYSSP